MNTFVSQLSRFALRPMAGAVGDGEELNSSCDTTSSRLDRPSERTLRCHPKGATESTIRAMVADRQEDTLLMVCFSATAVTR